MWSTADTLVYVLHATHCYMMTANNSGLLQVATSCYKLAPNSYIYRGLLPRYHYYRVYMVPLNTLPFS
jgi:hypothetical protein